MSALQSEPWKAQPAGGASGVSRNASWLFTGLSGEMGSSQRILPTVPLLPQLIPESLGSFSLWW